MTNPAKILSPELLSDRMFPRTNYQIDVGWRYLEAHLEMEFEVGLDLNPNYQRDHVWTDAQRVAYLEHILLGGEVGRTLIVAHVGRNEEYHNRPDGSIYLLGYSLVDGKQRLETVRRFLKDEIRIFAGIGGKEEGYLWSECSQGVRIAGGGFSFRWVRVSVPTKADLCGLYLKFNEGGTPHTKEELDRVRKLEQELRTDGQ